MKCTLIGTRKLDFVNRDNENIKGLQLHVAIDTPNTDKSVQGRLVDKVFLAELPDGTYPVIADFPLKVGSSYEFLYDLVPNRRKPVLNQIKEVK